MEIVILVGLSCAAAAFCACFAVHAHAERHAWKEMRRYTAGGFIWLVAIAPPTFAALPIETAVLLYGMDWLVIGAMGLAVGICYAPPVAMPKMEDDPLLAKLDEEINHR